MPNQPGERSIRALCLLIFRYCTTEVFIAHSQGTTRIQCNSVYSLEPFQRYTMPYRADVLLLSYTELVRKAHPVKQQHQPWLLSPAPGVSPTLSLACVSWPASGSLTLCGKRSCVCLVYPEWHWGWNSDLSHETVWETKFPLSKLCHVSTSCSASNFYKRRRELSAETCQ